MTCVGYVQRLHGRAIAGVGLQSDCQQFVCTGVPPILTTSVQISKLKMQVEHHKATITSLFATHVQNICSEIQAIPSQVESRLREEFHIEGVAQVSRRDVEQAINGLEKVSIVSIKL